MNPLAIKPIQASDGSTIVGLSLFATVYLRTNSDLTTLKSFSIARLFGGNNFASGLCWYSTPSISKSGIIGFITVEARSTVPLPSATASTTFNAVQAPVMRLNAMACIPSVIISFTSPG